MVLNKGFERTQSAGVSGMISKNVIVKHNYFKNGGFGRSLPMTGTDSDCLAYVHVPISLVF